MLARINPATGEVECIDPTGGCVPVNIFGEQDISDAAADYLRIQPVERTRVDEQVVEASANGTLLELPAGPLKAAVGVSWRKTSYVFTPDRSFENGDSVGFFASTAAAGSTHVSEVFGETLVPVISDKPFARELSAELGGRYSHYDSVGGVVTWKAMANWSPFQHLRFRGGFQKAVRAPNARELYEESTAAIDTVLDPCAPADGLVLSSEAVQACERNGAAGLSDDPYAAVVHRSGSTNLKAETARTLTIGAVMQPLRWLDATLDYYNIDIRDAIGPFGGGGGFIIAGCIFGGADPADPLCQAYSRGPDGFVTDVFVPTANLARLRTRGIDWQLNARLPLLSGKLQLSLSGTRLLASDVQVNPDLAPLRCAGSFGFPCGNTITGTATPRWKLFNQAQWTIGPMSWTLRHRFFSATRDGRYLLSTTLEQPTPTTIPVVARTLGQRHYFDAAVAFDVASKFRLTFGVNNLTNKLPSLVGNQQVQDNTDPSLYDVLGRRLFVALAARLR
jgi:outer membrane receptor protein involved in Fe transport